MTTPDRPTDTPDAAAERLARYKYGDTRPYEKHLEPCVVDLDKVERDRVIVVDAYLALRTLRAAGTTYFADNADLYAAACRALEEAHNDPEEIDVRMLAEFVKDLVERQADTLRPAAGTPDAGPTIGQAYARLAPWLCELDTPDLDNFYAVLARLRDEWQARGTPDAGAVVLTNSLDRHIPFIVKHRGEPNLVEALKDEILANLFQPARTPDPSPAGEADLAAERLSDLVAYDPDLKLVLAELPRLRAALAAVEAKLAEVTKERDRCRREILAAGNNPNGFDWSVLERLDRLETAEADLAAEREKRRAAEGREAEIWEKAAKVCDSVSRQHWGRTADGAFECAVAIRNLAAPAGPGEAGEETT